MFRCLQAGTAGVRASTILLGRNRSRGSCCLNEVTASGSRLDGRRRNLGCGCCLYRPIFSLIRRGRYGVLHRLFLRRLVRSFIAVGHVETSFVPESLLYKGSALVIGSLTNDSDIISFILSHSGSIGQYNNTSVTNIHNQDRRGSSTVKAMIASERPSFYPDCALGLFCQGQRGTLFGLTLALTVDERTNDG